MDNCSIFKVFEIAIAVVGGLAVALFVYFVVKKQLTMTRFTRFLGVLIIATASSLVPFHIIGLVFGFPSALLASILITCFLDKNKKGDK